jgi:SAM-dependent methyltransferase
MYSPEKYWNDVASEIANRESGNIIAGDDEPYYRYKRNVLLKQLKRIPFANQKVLELGCGPGGNLFEISLLHPSELWGCDVSEEMLKLAAKRLADSNVQLKKTNGADLPFPDNYFNLSLTITVLQHNTDSTTLKRLIAELCRITINEIYIFERIEPTIKGHESNHGRPVSYYQSLFQDFGFALQAYNPVATPVSYFVCGVIRKVFNSKNRKEGERPTDLSIGLQKLTLPITSLLDKLVPTKRDLTMLHFKRTK